MINIKVSKIGLISLVAIQVFIIFLCYHAFARLTKDLFILLDFSVVTIFFVTAIVSLTLLKNFEFKIFFSYLILLLIGLSIILLKFNYFSHLLNSSLPGFSLFMEKYSLVTLSKFLYSYLLSSKKYLYRNINALNEIRLYRYIGAPFSLISIVYRLISMFWVGKFISLFVIGIWFFLSILLNRTILCFSLLLIVPICYSLESRNR